MSSMRAARPKNGTERSESQVNAISDQAIVADAPLYVSFDDRAFTLTQPE